MTAAESMTELVDNNLGVPEMLGALTALTLVVVELYRRMSSNTARVTEKLDKCEERHAEREVEMRDMAGRLGRLEGEQEGVRLLAKQVLDVVAALKK